MKTLLLVGLLLVLGLARPAAAQDLLTRLDGTEITVKVLEITPELIKYKRADNPNGPLISVRKADVFRIRYANGTQEVVTAPAGSAPAPAGAAPVPGPVVAPGQVAATSGPVVAPAYPSPGAGVPAGLAAPAGGAPVVYVPATQPTPTNVVTGDEKRDGETVHLDGPRIGCTVLTAGPLAKAHELVDGLNPLLTQFGWQFEGRLFRLPNGVSGLVEFVPLVGGLEQGRFIPSISGLLGVRGPKGLEFGLGPNLTPAGTGIVLAAGTSFRSNGINFPVNVAVVPGQGGARISLLVGFNTRRN